MDHTATFEYVVSPKHRPAYRLRRLLAICGYVLYIIALLIVGLVTKLGAPMLALIPLTTWILVWLTWRYVAVEFEYSLTGGIMTLSRIYGGRTRKRVAEIIIKSMIAITPYEGDYIEAARRYAPERTLDFTADLQHPNVYCALYETAEQRRGILYFEATEHALRILRYYNSSTVVKDLSGGHREES